MRTPVVFLGTAKPMPGYIVSELPGCWPFQRGFHCGREVGRIAAHHADNIELDKFCPSLLECPLT